MKKIITFVISISFFFSSVLPSFAAENGQHHFRNDSNLASREAMKVERMQDNTTEHVQKLNDRAGLEIERRIASLEKLVTRINSIKRLTPDQKTSFITQIQSEITNLKALEVKIKTNTDTASLKTDVQSIVKSYRVYALFMPKIEIIAAADRMESVADQMSSLSAKLQTRINESKAAGNDVATAESSLSDMNLKIADAKTQANNAITKVLPLTPDGYPGNKSVLQSAKGLLKIGHQDIIAAHHDAQEIIKGLHTLFKEKNGSSSGFMKPIKSNHFPKSSSPETEPK